MDYPRALLTRLALAGILCLCALPASGSEVFTIDDDFAGATVPWSGGGWNKVFESATESPTSPPGEDQAFFSHNPANGGSVSVLINPDGSTTGAGIISDSPLLTVGMESATATLTIKAQMGLMRLMLMSDPGMSFATPYLSVGLEDFGALLRVRVTTPVGLSATNIYLNTIAGGPSSIEAGDRISMTCDRTYVTSLTYYDASTGTTFTLIDGTNKVAHGRNIDDDFPFGMYLAAEAVNYAVTSAQTFGIERLQGSTTVASQGSYSTYDWSQVPQQHPGIQHAQLTLSSPRLMLINAMRVDLSNPGIRLAHSEKYTSWVPDSAESVWHKPSDMITSNRARGVNMVAAINASAYASGPGGTSANVLGLAMDRGTLVSPPEATVVGRRTSFTFDTAGFARIRAAVTGFDTSNVFTAVSGYAKENTNSFVLQKGYVTGGALLGPDPHTALGLSADNRYLILMTIDGRTAASLGATTQEVGEFLRYFGCFNGMNMDGGGSTCMATYQPATNSVQVLNVPSDGSERIVGSTLGVYYDPGTPPTVATAASANPSPVTGTTAALSVLGADDGGEANLTYTWETTGTPPAPVSFSTNGNNAAKNVTATFSKEGAYHFLVTIFDSISSVTSNASVTVNLVPTVAVLTPQILGIAPNATQQFSASILDQFGRALTSQPAFTWSVTGGGTINAATGLFTAGGTLGGPFTVTASGAGVNGTANVLVTLTSPPVVATGGSVTDIDGYRIHTFTGNGTFSVTSGGNVDVLIVAGGGGGGGYNGAGGGAGGYLYHTQYAVAAGNHTVTVGGGGAGGLGFKLFGSNGASSSFGSLSAIGGGGGAPNSSQTGRSGGSGGGGSGGYPILVGVGGAGTTGQGNAGGNSNAWPVGSLYAAGGGGGAGAAGDPGTAVAADGGSGISNDISGVPTWYAAGGGGGVYGGSVGGAGGSGIGGSGGGSLSPRTDGAANTGSGGGGASWNLVSGFGGSGGSGIVIVRYLLADIQPPDTNSNGIPDTWEIQYFGGIDSPNGAASFDADGDGMTNLQEYLSGTSPNDPASKLQVAITSVTLSGAVLQFPTVTGRIYTVECSDTLAEGSWTILPPADIPGTGEVLEVTDAAVPAKRFYRLRVSLP